MINKITFKNYKLFKEKQTIQLKPITILIGKNNTGKSAVLKLMTIIEGALKSKENIPVQLINDNVSSGTDFKDLVYGKFGRALEIELFQHNKRIEQENRLQFQIAIDVNKNLPLLDYWQLNEDLKLRFIEPFLYENEIDGEEYNCEFLGVYLNNYFYKDKSDVSGTIYPQNFQLNTDFIGSIRESAKLDYRLNSTNESKSGIDGKNLYDFMIKDYLSTDKKYFNQISSWIKEKFEGWEIYIDVDSEPYHIELKKGNLISNLTETGMGISQSLPLITRAYKPCDEETLIIIEEPESHLHPYAHAQLAQLFVDSIKEDTNKQYLIETHSQNFILRLRKLVAEGKLNPDSINIYYIDFNEEKNESVLNEITVDRLGRVSFWPEGVFSETLEETIGIRTAQIQNVDVDRTKN